MSILILYEVEDKNLKIAKIQTQASLLLNVKV